MATKEQEKAEKDVLSLQKKQEEERKVAVNKFRKEAVNKFRLIKEQLDLKHKMEWEIEQLQSKIQIMKHMGGEENAGLKEKMNEMGKELVKEKMNEMGKELEEKVEEMESLEQLNQTLIMEERKTIDELQNARIEIIQELMEIRRTNHTHVGVKRMGEVDIKPFIAACKKKFPTQETLIKAAEYCSKYQNELRKPDWQPLKMMLVNGKFQEVINEDDEKLLELKRELGVEAYDAVVTALLEMNEYNPNGRCTVPELWNFSEKRKAALNEGVAHVMSQWKALCGKRKR